jgi:hypothetical protein
MSLTSPPSEAGDPQVSFAQAVAVAIGGGLASALLFGLSAQGSFFSAILAAVAPLPIMAAGLGFTHWAGLLAALVGALGLSTLSSSLLGVLYFGALAGPAWHLARLALQRREAGWRPLPDLALWAVVIGVAVAVMWIAFIARAGGGDFDAALVKMAERLAPMFDGLAGGATLPEGVTAQDVALGVLRMLPLAAAASSVFAMLVNLWLAGRVTAMSGLLARPWPDLPKEFGLPRAALGLLAGGLAFALLDDMPGRVGGVVAAACFAGFVLHGLAVAHFLTRDWPQRTGALGGLYVMMSFIPWAAVAVGLFGIADALFGLRARRSPPPSSPI